MRARSWLLRWLNGQASKSSRGFSGQGVTQGKGLSPPSGAESCNMKTVGRDGVDGKG